ncbi:aldo/keto reductase [Nocardioides acrostichi]|uniref:Aldo/keto reductase n=1 Tax=Nocardioides acrostichi TaxID=2784339 RepID=A0A930UYR5_9ACTN|nr:aldo/keto reductase [Nocardioides acrostichi]MBF4163353.1 aldo/keto reductase [Nocardioides acrostichi]
MSASSHPHDLTAFVLGCSQLGGLYRVTTDEEAQETLETAWELGVRAFDTAPHYGAGLSERRLGAFLATRPREEFTVSTKVGRLLVPTEEDTDGDEGFFGGDRCRRVLDYSRDGVLRSLEASLARLGLDRVDTVYVHDPDEHLAQTVSEALPALVGLREQGVVSHVGAGMNTVAPLQRIVAETGANGVMLAGRYSLLDRSAGPTLLPACEERDVRVVVAGVFNSGIMAEPGAGGTYDYGEAPPAVVQRAARVRELCEQYDVPVRAAAIQFPLRHPGVTQVAVGCRGRGQVDDNVAMLGVPVPEDLWAELGH